MCLLLHDELRNVIIVSMTSWLPSIEGRSGPKYLAIADSISEAITSGTLDQGSKLPPQRNLAYDLGVTLGTVTRAYREVERRGLTGGEVGRGTFVLGPKDGRRDIFMAQQPLAPNIVEMIHAIPVIRLDDPVFADTLRTIADEPEVNRLLGYQTGNQNEAHMRGAVTWLRRCGLDIDEHNVTITTGGQQAILAALMAVAEPGDTILVEELTFPGMIHLARTLGYRLEPVAMDDMGLMPEALENHCKHSSAKVLYCMPTLHNPTLATMPLERRKEIVALAEKYGLMIIEDDIWGMMAESGIPTIASLLPSQTVYLASLSKCLAGGLRTGFTAASPTITQKLRAAVKMICWMAPPLMVEIATRWIADGTAEKLTEQQKKLTATRVDLLRSHLKSFGLISHATAHHAWLPLPEPWRSEDFRLELERRGVHVLTESAFAAGRKSSTPAIRLTVGQPDNDAAIERAAEAFVDILSGRRQRDEMFL